MNEAANFMLFKIELRFMLNHMSRRSDVVSKEKYQNQLKGNRICESKLSDLNYAPLHRLDENDIFSSWTLH